MADFAVTCMEFGTNHFEFSKIAFQSMAQFGTSQLVSGLLHHHILVFAMCSSILHQSYFHWPLFFHYLWHASTLAINIDLDLQIDTVAKMSNLHTALWIELHKLGSQFIRLKRDNLDEVRVCSFHIRTKYSTLEQSGTDTVVVYLFFHRWFSRSIK